MHKTMLLILCLSLLFGNSEPFYNYKHDKVYDIVNNGLIPLIDGKLDDSSVFDMIARLSNNSSLTSDQKKILIKDLLK